MKEENLHKLTKKGEDDFSENNLIKALRGGLCLKYYQEKGIYTRRFCFML